MPSSNDPLPAPATPSPGKKDETQKPAPEQLDRLVAEALRHVEANKQHTPRRDPQTPDEEALRKLD
jgi:hypothetical protein